MTLPEAMAIICELENAARRYRATLPKSEKRKEADDVILALDIAYECMRTEQNKSAKK